MSNDKQITRRASLRGIAATGAILGSTGLTASTVSASETKTDAVTEVYFKDCHAVAVHLKDDYDEVPIRIRTYNDDTNRFVNIERTISDEHLLPFPIWEQLPDDYDEEDDHNKKKDRKDDHEDDETDKKKGDHELPEWICEDDVEPPKGHKPDDYDGKHVWVFNIHQFYNHAVDTDDKIVSVDIGGKRTKNPNCDKKYRSEYDKKGDVDIDDIGLVAICFDSKRNTARFRVDNDNKKSVTVEYDVYNADQDGELTVEPQSRTYFDVAATGSEGQATVRLFYDDEQIDVKASNTQRNCVDDVILNSYKHDLIDERARFTVGDSSEFDRVLSYYIAETGESGTVTVPDSVSNKESFWVHAPYGHASVTLYHHGIVVGKAESDPDLSGPVVNITQGESYETIQAAVDSAGEGDTIVVCEDEDLGRGRVVIDVPGLTLKGFDKPTVRQAHDARNPGYPVFDVLVDDITIKGFRIERVLTGTNSGSERFGQGIKIGGFQATGGDNATILNNKIVLIDEQDPDNDETDNNVMFGVAVIEPQNGDQIDTATIAGNKIKGFDVEPYEGSIEDAGIAIFDGQEEVVLKKNKLKDNECGILFVEDLEDNIEFDGNEFDDNDDDKCSLDLNNTMS